MKKEVRFIKKGKKWALAEVGGKQLTPFVFSEVLPFVREIGVGKIDRYGAFFFSEYGGTREFRQAFDSVEWVPGPFNQETGKWTPIGYKVEHKGLSCVLDLDLNTVVPWGRYRINGPFEGIYDINNNLAECGFAGFGRVLVPCQYSRANRFYNGYASVENREKKWGVIDPSGNEVVPFIYDWIATTMYEGVFEAERDGKCGYIDARGVEVIPFEFKTVTHFNHGLANVETLDGRHRTINHRGEFVNEFEKRMTVPKDLVSKSMSIPDAADLARRRILLRRYFDKLEGATFVSLRSVPIEYITWFAAPCSLSGKDRLPKGTRFTLNQKMRSDAYYCSIDRKDELKRIYEKEREHTNEHLPRLKGRFSGFSLFLTEDDLLTRGAFRRVRASRKRNAKKD